ncbi:YceI family protein [Streptomyces sp. NPDC004111]|uniref:YceI family protein n=1 Tax=Streptomyces sp. NPDC004111 TaxID=3364690 RepID=UPI00367B7424
MSTPAPTPTDLTSLTGDHVLDVAASRIGFVAKHTMAGRVPGTFEEFEGGAHLDGGRPENSSAWLSVRAQTLGTGNPQRDGLLHGKFLDVEHHPALTFTSTRVKQTDATHFKVTGDLTVRGTTRQVTLDVELTGGAGGAGDDGRIRFRGSALINRNDWDVNWNATTTFLVSAKVLLEFDATLVRQP